jgi:membrane protein YdbS with pleckstrin-like domain
MTWLTLAPQARLLFYLRAFTRLVVFWVPVTVFAATMLASQVGLTSAFGGAAAWLFVQFLAALWMPALSFERWAYAVRERDLLIARGVLFRVVTAIPLQRIQHVDVRQGPIEQWLGLSQVQISTASGAGADGVIQGLTTATAEALRDRLVAASGDDGV